MKEANTMIKEAMKLALEALEPDVYRAEWAVEEDKQKAITTLSQAIEQAQKQEPVAWHHAEDYKTYFTTIPSKDLIRNGYWTPLYTSPPQRPAAVGEDIRKPLTDEEIGAILEGVNAYGTRLYTFARAIEAAHGIKE